MEPNAHFLTLESWDEVESAAGFGPRIPTETLGHSLRTLQLFVRDHRMREVPAAKQVLEAHFGAFVLSQSLPGVDAARTLALDTRYGASSMPARIGPYEAPTYQRGPEPQPDDLDGRMPAVVTWAEDARFFLIASHELNLGDLMTVAASLYSEE